VKVRTAELASKNRDILDNLHYARRIQSAILPEAGIIASSFRESFIIYRPKDIVSGDFYSFSKKDNTVIFSVADCTGHGVTGAFLSMIGLSLINQLVNEQGITQPSQILNLLNTGMLSSLKHKSNDINDGMDIALCSYDLGSKKLEFAGANRPLYIIHKDKLHEIKSDKMAIGGFRLNENAVFTNHSFSMETGDSIYLFTDGFVDQFGGEDGKKLLAKRMRDYLLSISRLSMHEQEIKLNHFFDEWKGKNEQVDDVLVIGVRC
jgi:serine phosphatase RsbU (regulator of sigma subunit)